MDYRHKYYHYYGIASYSMKCVFDSKWNIPKPHIKFSKRRNVYVVYGLMLRPFMNSQNWKAYNQAKKFVRILNERRRVQQQIISVDRSWHLGDNDRKLNSYEDLK